MAKITNEMVAEAYETLAAFYRQQSGGSADTTTDAADESGVEVPDEETVRNLGIKDLRTLAVELELDEQKQKAGILAEMEAKSLFGDSDNEDEEEEEYEDEEDEEGDDEDGDEEEDEEEEELSREDLEEMSLKELRDLAKQEGIKATEYRSADKDALVDLLAGDDEEDEDEEEAGEEEELDEEALMAMSLAEVKKVASEVGVKVPPRISKNKKKIVEHIMENAAE